MAIDAQEFFYKLKAWQRYLIVAGVGFIILAIAYWGPPISWLGYTPISDIRGRCGDLNKAINSIKIEIINQQKILAEKPKLLAKITQYKKKLQAMVASLPEKQEIEVLLKRITDLLAETNLIQERFVPLQEKINEELFYAQIPLQLNVRGDYQKIGEFLTRLNDLPRIVNVPAIKLHKAGGLSPRESELQRKLQIVSLDADIHAVTYRRLSQAEIKAIMAKKAHRGRRPPRRR
jgi:Tfp pilus assembly protein PilO